MTDAWAAWKNPALLSAGRAEIALLDQDAGALEHARDRIQALAAQADVEVTLRCVNTSIKTVITDGLDDSYDLVYSAGLFDYLKDPAVRAAGTRLVDALAPGGHAVIGNFDVANPRRSGHPLGGTGRSPHAARLDLVLVVPLGRVEKLLQDVQADSDADDRADQRNKAGQGLGANLGRYLGRHLR